MSSNSNNKKTVKKDNSPGKQPTIFDFARVENKKDHIEEKNPTNQFLIGVGGELSDLSTENLASRRKIFTDTNPPTQKPLNDVQTTTSNPQTDIEKNGTSVTPNLSVEKLSIKKKSSR